MDIITLALAKKYADKKIRISENKMASKLEVENIKEEILDIIREFHYVPEWRTLELWGYGECTYISPTKLPAPTKIRIDHFTLPKNDSYVEMCGDYEFLYRSDNKQTFDIAPDENGNFSVTVNFDLVRNLFYDEELGMLLPTGEQEVVEQNATSIKLDFIVGYDDQSAHDPETGEFTPCTWICCPTIGESQYGCTVSLLI